VRVVVEDRDLIRTKFDALTVRRRACGAEGFVHYLP
jgi:hypothetical protein